MASSDAVRDILNDLMKFYDRKQSPAQKMFYEASMDDYNDDWLCKAIMNLKASEPPNRFPTVATIRKYYLEQRDLHWQKQKRNSPRFNGLNSLANHVYAPVTNVESYLKLMAGIGKMPKDEWLKMGVTLGMFTVADAAGLKEAWSKMGADPTHWVGRSFFE